LKAAKVDVIVVFGYPTAVAAKAAGIPTVVVFGIGDPVATGLVVNLARPEGNITGISDVATTLSTKRLGAVAETSSRGDAVEQGRPRDVAALRRIGKGGRSDGDRSAGGGCA
jgi:ABC-type nitrate/sulfonate/bicarbonate transport system substrate-binding protein